MRPPRKIAANAAPGTSKGPSLSPLVSGTYFSATTTVTAAIGALIRKIQRQLAYSTRPPPTNGPIAAAMLPRPDQAPIARPRSARTNTASMIARLPGVSRAPPIPCRTRAAIRVVLSGATPQSTDAAANQTTPITNTRRRPSRSPSAPPSRIRLASIRRYPLVIHCSCANEASRSLPIVFRATLTTVPSSIAIPEPSTAASTTPRPTAEEYSIVPALTP